MELKAKKLLLYSESGWTNILRCECGHADDAVLDGVQKDVCGGWHDAGDYNKYNGNLDNVNEGLELWFTSWDDLENVGVYPNQGSIGCGDPWRMVFIEYYTEEDIFSVQTPCLVYLKLTEGHRTIGQIVWCILLLIIYL